MKICLFSSIGNLGIVTGWKKLMFDDHLIFQTDREGELRNDEVRKKVFIYIGTFSKYYKISQLIHT